jgi:uncharacterized protein (TIGR03086 family)
LTEAADRYARVADGFTARVDAVPEASWDAPTPCDGWVARDVVGHLTEWVPSFFFTRWGASAAPIPVARDDPRGAWHALDAAIRRGLDTPEIADASAETPMGAMTFERSIDMLVTGDVLVHTWDLARAAGLDEALDAAAVHRMLDGIEAMDEAMRASGHYGPRVAVDVDADEQTRLLAFTGRQP